MLKLTRHKQIQSLVDENGHVSVAELNEMLNVSEATIRRDLDELSQLGWLRRTHGGAIRVERADRQSPILQRQVEHSAEKERIGRRAAALVQPGQTVFLGSGSTVAAMVAHIQEIDPLTVITNSLPVINQLAGRENIELIAIGGVFRQSERSMVGHIAEQAIREFRADQVFMGMFAIDVVHGFTSDYLPEAMTDRTVLGIAPRCVVVADHTKFGRVSTVFLADVTAAHVIVSDTQLPSETAAELREAGLQVLLA